MYYRRRRPVKVKSTVDWWGGTVPRALEIILLNLSHAVKWGQCPVTVTKAWQTGIPAWGTSHTTGLLLMKQTPLFSSWVAPLAASLSDSLLVMSPISHLCILLWVLQKYCFSSFWKLSSNQTAPAGMRWLRHPFQRIQAYAVLPWQQDLEAEPWPWACQSLQPGGLSTSRSPAHQVVMPTISNENPSLSSRVLI